MNIQESDYFSTVQIEEIANRLIGVPFVRLGRNPLVGLDCWGLVLEFYKRLGIIFDDPSTSFYFSGKLNRNIFVKTENPFIGGIVAMNGDGSQITSHVAVLLNFTYLLNTAPQIGVHRIRFHALYPRMISFYKPSKKILPQEALS